MSTKQNGVIVYNGPSMLDDAPIVGIVTGLNRRSNNPKTGNMQQLWILRSDIEPREVKKQKLDKSICGSCIHSSRGLNSCYVRVGLGPLQVFKAYKRGSYGAPLEVHQYPSLNKLRYGSYGDPAALPDAVLERLYERCVSHTGYSHQHGQISKRPLLSQLLMISVDTPKQAAIIASKGYRYFRVMPRGAPLLSGEILCRAVSHGETCAQCGLCNGTSNSGPNIAIEAHGNVAERYESKFKNIAIRLQS